MPTTVTAVGVPVAIASTRLGYLNFWIQDDPGNVWFQNTAGSNNAIASGGLKPGNTYYIHIEAQDVNYDPAVGVTATIAGAAALGVSATLGPTGSDGKAVLPFTVPLNASGTYSNVQATCGGLSVNLPDIPVSATPPEPTLGFAMFEIWSDDHSVRVVNDTNNVPEHEGTFTAGAVCTARLYTRGFQDAVLGGMSGTVSNGSTINIPLTLGPTDDQGEFSVEFTLPTGYTGTISHVTLTVQGHTIVLPDIVITPVPPVEPDYLRFRIQDAVGNICFEDDTNGNRVISGGLKPGSTYDVIFYAEKEGDPMSGITGTITNASALNVPSTLGPTASDGTIKTQFTIPAGVTAGTFSGITISAGNQTVVLPDIPVSSTPPEPTVGYFDFTIWTDDHAIYVSADSGGGHNGEGQFPKGAACTVRFFARGIADIAVGDMTGTVSGGSSINVPTSVGPTDVQGEYSAHFTLPSGYTGTISNVTLTVQGHNVVLPNIVIV